MRDSEIEMLDWLTDYLVSRLLYVLMGKGC